MGRNGFVPVAWSLITMYADAAVNKIAPVTDVPDKDSDFKRRHTLDQFYLSMHDKLQHGVRVQQELERRYLPRKPVCEADIIGMAAQVASSMGTSLKKVIKPEDFTAYSKLLSY